MPLVLVRIFRGMKLMKMVNLMALGKTIGYFSFLMGLLSCDFHYSKTSVMETHSFKKVSLDKKDLVLKAFLEKDYKALNKIFESGTPIDILFNKKTLLVMAIKNWDLTMIHFLIEHQANPDIEIQLKGKEGEEEGTYTPRELVLEVEDEELKEVLVALLESNISLVNEFLYYKNLETIDSKTSLDLKWLKTLLSLGVDHTALTEERFINVYIENVGRAVNRQEFYYELVTLTENTSLLSENWLSWLEAIFVSGRYSLAQCHFTENQCETIDSFIKTCLPKFQRSLKRAAPQLSAYVEFRNALLLCPQPSSPPEDR